MSEVCLVNAFSLNMLDSDLYSIGIERIDAQKAAQAIQDADMVTNAIGHPDTDAVVRGILRSTSVGIDVPEGERANIRFDDWDTLLVAQYIGPRLPEGATSLPEGARIDWFLVWHQEHQ